MADRRRAHPVSVDCQEAIMADELASTPQEQAEQPAGEDGESVLDYQNLEQDEAQNESEVEAHCISVLSISLPSL